MNVTAVCFSGKLYCTVTNATPLDRLRIVLCQTSHPGNIGAAARAMKTMGVARLFLVQPQRFPDPEADARASGATDILAAATVCESLDAALAGCVLAVGLSARPRELIAGTVPVRAAALEAIAYATAGDVALVFGTEMFGLTNDELTRCQLLAMIPANPDYASLNLAAAVQVVCYELRMAAGADAVVPAPTFPPATQDEIERLYRHAARTLIALNFLNPRRPKRLLPRLRRLFARTRLEHEEVSILRGILARIDEVLPGKKRPPPGA
jgi:tRNA/rRNA methyltransferase